MRVIYNWPAIIGAALFLTLLVGLIILPFINPCEYEDSIACTWNATAQGNGHGLSFTNFWGMTFYIYPPA